MAVLILSNYLKELDKHSFVLFPLPPPMVRIQCGIEEQDQRAIDLLFFTLLYQNALYHHDLSLIHLHYPEWAMSITSLHHYCIPPLCCLFFVKLTQARASEKGEPGLR